MACATRPIPITDGHLLKECRAIGGSCGEAQGPKNETLAGDNRTWPNDRSFRRDPIHKSIVVTGVVMKYYQSPNPGGVG